MKKVAITGALLSLALTLAAPGFAQAPQRAWKGGGGASGSDEYAAYNAMFNEKDPAKRAPLAEKFVSTFKDSDYGADVYQMLSAAYQGANQNAKVVEVADRFEQSPAFKSPFVTDKNRIVIFSNAATSAFAAGNMDKMNADIDKELANDPSLSNPATVNMLLTIAPQLPENLPKDAAAQKAVLDRTQDLITKADNAVKKLQGVPPAQLAPINANIQATYGMLALTNQNYDEAVKRYEESTKLNATNDISWYRLGLAYQGQAVGFSKKLEDALKALNAAKAAKADQATQDDLNATFDALTEQVKGKQAAAMDALGKSVSLAGPAAGPARTALENLWKPTHNNSTDGLDAFIASKKG